MKQLVCLTLAFCTLAPASFAAYHNEMAVNASAPKKQKESAKALGLNGIYKFSKSTEVIPQAVIFNDNLEQNIGGVSIDVTKNEPVAIEYMDDGNILMTLRLPGEELGKVPEQLIISQEEFKELGLELFSTGGVDELMAKHSGYEETDVAARNGGQMRARRHTVRQETSRRGFRRDGNGRIAGGGGNCVAVVKSLTGFRGTAGNGVGMASALQRRGWKSISPSAKSRGTVCSWAGGFHGKGHVAWFDGSCFQPTYGGNCGSPGKNYRMIKCVHKG